MKIENSIVRKAICRNAKFKVGDRVKLKGGNRTGKITGIGDYKSGDGEKLHPDDYTVRWDSYSFDVPVKPENLVAANAEADVKNAVDAEKNPISRGDTVIYADEENEDDPTEYRVTGVSGDYVYLSGGNHAYGRDLLVYNSKRNSKKAVCNGIGDCFADAVFLLEKAAKKAGKPSAQKSDIREAKDAMIGHYGVMSYDYAEPKHKSMAKKCASAIDKALSDPSEQNIIAARWECEKGRAYADGGSPRRAFWNCSTRVAMNAVRNAMSPEDIQRKVAADLAKLEKRTADEIAKQVESFCYWMESDIGRQIEYYKRIMKENGITDAKITAQLSAIEKHVKSACDQAKRIK